MIYLLGGSGYVGSAYQALLQRKNIPFRNLRRADFDYTETAALTDLLRREKPEFLINAAGYTGKPNVDACELHKAECLFGNAVLPGRVAEACTASGVPWGHVSSGCIYTGAHPDGSGFSEEDTPNFSFRTNHCSFYSGTKALGEEILADATSCYIWRLRIPFSNVDSPRNYLSKVMNYDTLLEAENSLSELHEFVDAALDCFTKNVEYGIYNLTNPGSVTTSDVVKLIQAFGLTDKEFRFFESEASFMKLAAKTPRSNCVLDSSKALAAGLKLRPIEESIKSALGEWVKIE